MEEPLEVLEESDCEINRLFPKCQPRYLLSNRSSAVTDLNLNRIRGSDDNDNYRIACFSTPQPIRDEEVTSYSSSISRMSVDTASATSSASGSHSDASASSSSSNSVHCDRSAEIPATSSYPDCEEARSSILDSSYEESQVRQSSSTNALRSEHYRLRDSRIEAAGGRELYCQSRIRPKKRHTDTRRVHSRDPFYYHNAHMSSQSSSQVNQLAPRRNPHLSELHKETSSSRSDTTITSPESSFEDGVSESSAPTGEAAIAKVESPLVYETQLDGSTEVVFDDIGEWVTRGLHVKGYSGDSREKSFTGCESFSHSQSEQDSEIEEHSIDSVKKIGNVPIAEYEGSPRRYGVRTSTRHHSPRSLYLLPPIHRIPRPGFPRRISSDDKKSKETLNPNALPVFEKSYPQKRDKNSSRSLNTRDKKYVSKGKSRINMRERRNETSFRNKDVNAAADTSGNSTIRAEEALETFNRKSFSLKENCQNSGKESYSNCNSIPNDETEEKVDQTPTISISTLASVYSSHDDKHNIKEESDKMQAQYDLFNITNSMASKYCDYEESETHKVLQEFFQGTYSKLSKQDFLDLEYTLKRHQGNSYVGQRLAGEVEPEESQELEFSKEKIDLINQLPCALSTITDISLDSKSNMDAEDDEEVESSRNLTISPTTTCDSVEAESEYSAGELEGSVHSSLKGVCPTMPILEDGLSSGEETDSDITKSQSKLDEENEMTSGIIDQLSNEDIEYNCRNPVEVQRILDAKADVEIHQMGVMYGKTFKVRARSFDDHLCRGEIPSMNNKVISNNIRREPLKSHSLEPSSSPDHFPNIHHGFSFNIPENEAMLKHSSPYRNAQPSPSSSTLSLMKKQITEIEREIALKKPDCLSRKYDQDVVHSALDIHRLDPLLEKICEPPPPPAPHPHRGSNDIEENGMCLSGSTTPGYSSGVLHSPQITHGSIPGPQLLSAKGSVGSPVQVPYILQSPPIPQDMLQKPVTSSPSRESVEAAIADIKQAIRKTRNVSLKNYPQERPDTDKGPVWIPRTLQEFCEESATSSPNAHEHTNDHESSPSRGSIPSRDRSEEDGDTDQETDRLLGRQRSRNPGYINDKEKEKNKKKGKSKEVMVHETAVLIEGVLFRARYLGSTQLVSEGQPTKTTRMMQAEEAVSRIKAPEGEPQPSTEVDLFISTEKIMVLNTDLKEIMMDHALRTISYIADIGDLVVLMARRRVLPSDEQSAEGGNKTPKMICHVFESDEAQFIAQSIGQAFQVAYLEFLKANGIEDHSFVKEMDYQEVLNSQEIFGDELQMFAKKELQKEVVVPKMKSEILGVVVVESGWGSMVPTVVIANLSPTGAAAKCGQLNIGDQIIAINGVSLVGLPLSTCQNYIKNTKYNTAVKLTVVPCPPVVEVKIRRPDTKYQLGFSVQNGVICSLLRGGIAERGGVRVGHRIIDINSQSVVAVPHEKIVNLLATSVGEIRMKTMPTSIFRLLTGQETPQYI